MSPLTPPVRFQTSAPFPSIKGDEETGELRISEDSTAKVTVESFAELMNIDIKGSNYGSSSQFVLLHDLQGQPMILSIGTDKHVYICAYVNGGLGSWEVFDINPGADFEAAVCDASISPDNKQLVIAASGNNKSDKTKTKLYNVAFQCPTLACDVDGKLLPSAFDKLSWQETGQKIANRVVNSIVCEFFGGAAQYHIVAGVQASTWEGSHYIYNPSLANDWTIVKFPLQVEKIRSVVAANIPALGPGFIVLFEDNTPAKNVACLYQGDGVSKQVNLTGLKNAKRLSTSINRRGYTDILVAAENGIGFIDHKISEPKLLFEGIAYSSVFASENSVSSKESKLLIHAVSDHGELFIIEGSRTISPSLGAVNFPASAVPIPIRTEIRNITGRVNPLTHAFEIVYTTNENDQLNHLSRDPQTSLWKETAMITKSKSTVKKVRTPAFLLTVTLSDGKGTPVPQGYKVQLSSQPSLVYINDKTYNLTNRSQAIPVNQRGQLHIVVPTSNGISAEPIDIKFMPDTGETRNFKIQPAQRILHTLGSFKTADDLKNARSPDGKPLFSDAVKKSHEKNFDQAADVLAKLPTMLASADSDKPQTGQDGEEITLAWVKSDNGAKLVTGDWWSDANEAVGEVIGDVMEYLKTAVKGIVKVALKIVGPVLKLVLKIGAKVVRFVLNTVSSIVTSLSYLIEGLFGVDLSELRDWFSFRYKKVEPTQKELASLIDSGLLWTNHFLSHNHDVLEQSIDSIGHFLEGYISKPYTTQHIQRDSSSGSSILDNPIISNLLKFNPLGWILEATGEEMGEDFQIPPLHMNIGPQIFKALKDQFDILLGFLKRSWAGLTGAIGQPSSVMNHLYDIFRDGFWSIFLSIKSIIMALYDLVMNSFDAIVNFCRGKWVIPGITDLWEELTNSDFTLINFVSYVAAQLLEMANPTSKPVFEGLALGTALGTPDKRRIPSLLPNSLMDTLETTRLLEDDLVKEQVVEKISLKKQGVANTAGISKRELQLSSMITAPEPHFNLMAAPGPQFSLMAAAPKPQFNRRAATPEKLQRRDDPQILSLSPEIQRILEFVRSGKTLSRTANVAFQGLLQGGSGGSGSGNDSGADNGVGTSSSTSALDSSVVKGGKFEDAFEMSRSRLPTATSIDELEVAGGGTAVAAPMKSGSSSVGSKSVVIGSNAFGFLCRAIEQIILYNYYDEKTRSKENFEGNCVELFGSLIGLCLSCFADKPPVLALSNVAVAAGCFAGACIAPEKDFFNIAEMIGSGCSAASGVLFLVKEPTCQTIAWVGVVVDAANTIAAITNQLCLKRLRDGIQLPPTGEETQGGGPQLPEPTKPKPFRGGGKPHPKIDSDDEDPGEEKKRTLVVHQESAAKARALELKFTAVMDDYETEWGDILKDNPAPQGHAVPHPVGDLVLNQAMCLSLIQAGSNWWTNGVGAIRMSKTHFRDRTELARNKVLEGNPTNVYLRLEMNGVAGRFGAGWANGVDWPNRNKYQAYTIRLRGLLTSIYVDILALQLHIKAHPVVVNI